MIPGNLSFVSGRRIVSGLDMLGSGVSAFTATPTPTLPRATAEPIRAQPLGSVSLTTSADRMIRSGAGPPSARRRSSTPTGGAKEAQTHDGGPAESQLSQAVVWASRSNRELLRVA